jgi:regulator of ribonuclease activity A
MNMSISTSDLCDQFSDSHHIQIAEPIFKAFGGLRRFSGRVTTLKVFEDDVLIASTLAEKVSDGVLVVDGGGSHRCALVDKDLAQLASSNGWQAIVIYGCVRDSHAIAEIPIAIRALHSHPLKSHKKGHGDRDKLISFAGISFRTGCWVYGDEDGIVVSDEKLI